VPATGTNGTSGARNGRGSSGSVYRSTSTPAHDHEREQRSDRHQFAEHGQRKNKRGFRGREQPLWQAPLVERVQRGGPISFSKLE